MMMMMIIHTDKIFKFHKQPHDLNINESHLNVDCVHAYK
jgi:hypothetical protein